MIDVASQSCHRCGGSGEISCAGCCDDNGMRRGWGDCAGCRGRGKIACPYCVKTQAPLKRRILSGASQFGGRIKALALEDFQDLPAEHKQIVALTALRVATFLSLYELSVGLWQIAVAPLTLSQNMAIFWLTFVVSMLGWRK